MLKCLAVLGVLLRYMVTVCNVEVPCRVRSAVAFAVKVPYLECLSRSLAFLHLASDGRVPL